jgi:hypothetical protein
METFGIQGNIVGKPRLSNLYTPRRSAVDAVGDQLLAPAAEPRQGRGATARVGEVLISFSLLSHQSTLAPEA